MDVLLLRRSGAYLGGTWQMVSGRIERGETAWQAALREVREEVGIVPDRFYSANRLESFYEVSQNCINLVPIFVAFIDGLEAITLSDEHTDYRWVPYSELGDFVHFDHQTDTARWIFQHFVRRKPFEFLRIRGQGENSDEGSIGARPT
jgi:dATP pyrophosphohydrolase